MTLNHTYAVYLNSPEWGRKRREALDRAGGKCERCTETENLEVHHITYDRLGYERPQDLQVLCNPCHAAEHGRGAKNDRVIHWKETWKKANEIGMLEEQQQDALHAVLDELEANGELSVREIARLRGRTAADVRP